jgi:hypothetical protein
VIARWSDEARTERYLLQHRMPAVLESFMRDQHGPGHYSFPPEAIRSVILGSRLSGENEKWLRSVLGRATHKVPIRRASIGRDGIMAVE